jgi:hypothetical protein
MAMGGMTGSANMPWGGGWSKVVESGMAALERQPTKRPFDQAQVVGSYAP